jgi:hypothetical protein
LAEPFARPRRVEATARSRPAVTLPTGSQQAWAARPVRCGVRRRNDQHQLLVGVFEIEPRAADVAALFLDCNQLS